MLHRSLLVKNLGYPAALDLADENLQSLSFKEHHKYIGISSALPRLANFSCLTRLELFESKDVAEDSVQILRSLQLQELVLIDCRGLEQKLFVPGALTTLRRLHIEEKNCDIACASLLLDTRYYELGAVGDIIWEIAGLEQVSGMCEVFVVGMMRGLSNWEEADLSEGTMVSCKSSHSCVLNHMKVWTKPHD